ncbi:MAG: MATE family efflux transporter [Lachnospiraceae bacterium]|nr:MATE family efflux transporter [Lachnospiraceae bacterium]
MGNSLTEGKPLKIILKFMIPLLLGNVFQQFYNMVDAIIVGKYVGTNALAAVGSTGTIMFLVLGVSNGMSTGFTVLTSQKYGARQTDETRATVANGIILSGIVIVAMTAISLFFMHGILDLMNTPEDIYEDAYSYISVICMGIVAIVSYNLFAAFLRAIGNSKVPLMTLIFSALLNIVLDLLFIIHFRMGVAGAAWATNISQGIAALLCVVYIIRKEPVLTPSRNMWRLNRQYTRLQMYIGIPMALQFGITASGTMIMQGAINVYGSVAVAGFTAASKVQNLLTQGMMSIGQTMTSYSGQNYGKGDLDRVKQGVKDAMKIMVVYSIIAGVMVVLCLPYIMRLFFSADVDIASLLPWARIYILECAIAYIPLSSIFIFRNTMQGCGYGMTAMMLGIVEFFARLLAAFISIRVRSYALAVGADPLAWLSAGIMAAVLFGFVMKDIERKKRRMAFAEPVKADSGTKTAKAGIETAKTGPEEQDVKKASTSGDE